MAVAITDFLMGSSQRNIRLPEWLQGRREILGAHVGVYRSFLIVVCGALAVGLQAGLMRTRFGSRLRAAVDDARVARGLGIPVSLVFAATFAVGSGLAGLGGALGVELLGLDPYFPLKFMIYFLIVVTVGGTSGIMGPFVASMLLGIADVAGKYYLSSALGGFVIYVVLIVVLVLRPNGLFTRAR
jgi:branched-chain amino acid transport system permease protein